MVVTVRQNCFIEPRIPTRAAKPPVGPDWVHEIKHDGYRFIVRRDGDTVRLFTRRGYDWSDRLIPTARRRAFKPELEQLADRLGSRDFAAGGSPLLNCIDRVLWHACCEKWILSGRWPPGFSCHVNRLAHNFCVTKKRADGKL